MKIRTSTIQRLRDALMASGEKESAVASSAFRTLAKQGLLSDTEKQAMERVETVAEVMFLMMAADEEISVEEMATVRGAIRGLTGDALNDDIVQVMIEGYARRLHEEGRGQRLKDLAGALVEPSEAESAFSLAAAVAIADNSVAESERELLADFAGWLGFSDDQIKGILNQLESDAESIPSPR